MTSADIQRLQDQVYDTAGDISRPRSRDGAPADELQAQLDDLRDEAVYLKVKMRREGSVDPADYQDVRDRVRDVRAAGAWRSVAELRERGHSGATPTWTTNSGSGGGTYSGGTTSGPNRPPTTRRGDIPSGQELDVRLDRQLSSDTAQVEDRFTATTVADLYQGDDVLIPAGSSVRGVVSSVQNATLTQRKGTLTVAFDQMTVNGRTYPIHGTVTQALESEGIKGEVGKIGGGLACTPGECY